jgi:hypothetical protein
MKVTGNEIHGTKTVGTILQRRATMTGWGHTMTALEGIVMELNRATIKFMEGTVPNMTKAIDRLTKKLDEALILKDAGEDLDVAILDLEKEDAEENILQAIQFIEDFKAEWKGHEGDDVLVGTMLARMGFLAKVLSGARDYHVQADIADESGRISDEEAAGHGDSQVR